MRVNAPEHFFRKQIIAALQQPPAALIAASQVESEGNLRMVRHNGVVHFNSRFEPAIHGPALGLVKGFGPWIQQQAIVGRINLDIRSAQPDQFVNFDPEDIHDVGKEMI